MMEKFRMCFMRRNRKNPDTLTAQRRQVYRIFPVPRISPTFFSDGLRSLPLFGHLEREEDRTGTAQHQHRHGFTGRQILHELLEVREVLHVDVVDHEDHVAAAQPRVARGSALHVFDIDAGLLAFERLLLLGGEIGHDRAQTIVAGLVLLGGTGQFDVVLGRQLADPDLHRERLAATYELDLHLVADMRAADHGRQGGRIGDGDAVELEHHVTYLDAGLLRRTVGQYLRDQGAARPLHPERLGEFARHVLYQDTAPATTHLALGLDLIHLVHREVDVYHKQQPQETTRTTKDLRIDAHHLAVHVEQGTARVARIDGDVGLNEGYVILVGQAAPQGAHDTGRHRVIEVER